MRAQAFQSRFSCEMAITLSSDAAASISHQLASETCAPSAHRLLVAEQLSRPLRGLLRVSAGPSCQFIFCKCLNSASKLTTQLYNPLETQKASIVTQVQRFILLH